MRDWNLVVNQPVALTIAADARLIPFDKNDDQVWELNIGNSEPPAISFQTTFGLRARSCRIFPRFILEDQIINNPDEFHRPVTIRSYFANYIELSFKPFSSINVQIEYWVPDTVSLACRTKIFNNSRDHQLVGIEWAEILIPTEDGHRMTSTSIDRKTVLAGRTSDVSPVLSLSGGAGAGKSPYPSLDLASNIPPHQEQVNYWAHSALAEENDSFEHNKQVLNKNWDTEIARVIRQNSQRLEISTGNPAWDNAIYLSQTVADQLIVNSAMDDQTFSLITSRKPDQPFRSLTSIANTGRLKNGRASFDVLYCANFLLPGAPDIFQSLLNNLLPHRSSQSDEESPTLTTDQQTKEADTLLLSTIAWENYRYTSKKEDLRQLFSPLVTNFNHWFSESLDRDQDLIPEWSQPVQTGFEENPLFSFQGDLSIGVDISTVESPDLSSYLYQECQALISIAREINQEDQVEHLQAICTALKGMVEKTWDDTQASYFYRDRDSHISCSSKILAHHSGPGVIEVNQAFPQPCRPLIQIRTRLESTKPVQIYIQGMIPGGIHRVEHIEPGQVHWELNSGYFTSNYTYLSIEQIEISGITSDDEIILRTSGAIGEDITLLLPLWAGIPTPEQAKVLINLTILNKKRFLSTYGLRSYIGLQQSEEVPVEISSVRPFWMYFIMKGLLHYGERKMAAEIFARMMDAITKSISRDMTLHQSYNGDTGMPMGKTNSLDSLVPVELFIEILGIKIISPIKIEVYAGNPFPWPVTIKYHGLTVVHQEKKTLIIFADGQNITVDNQQPKVLHLELAEISA